MRRIAVGALACVASLAGFCFAGASAQPADAALLKELQKEIATLRARVHTLEQREAAAARVGARVQDTQPARKPAEAAAAPPPAFGSAYAAVPVKAPPPPPARTVWSGFYVRGDLGWAYSPNNSFTIDAPEHSTNPLDTFRGSLHIDGITDPIMSVYANVGLGYRFSPLFRADATVSFIAPQPLAGGNGSRVASEGGLIAGVGSVTPFTEIDPVSNVLSPAMHAQSTVAMVNGYLDLAGFWPETFHTVQPYLSGGVGASVNRLQGATLQITQPLFGPGTPMSVAFADHTQTEFAWSLGAGAAIALTDNVMLDFGYRYFDLGQVTSTAQSSFPFTCGIPVGCTSAIISDWTFKSHLSDHVVSVGFRAGL